MQQPFVPKLSLAKPAVFNDSLAGRVSFTAPATNNVGAPSFKEVLGTTLGNVNGVVSAPDGLMKEAMTTGRVDVHEIMIANAKAELAVNMTSQIVTKVVQAYDRVLQIQI